MIRFLTAFGILFTFAALTDAGDGDKAGDKKLDPEKVFKKLDANGDGKISKEEFAKMMEMRGKAKGKGKAGAGKDKEMLEKLFDKLDADNDGYLSMEEFKKLSELREQFKKKKAQE